MSLGTNNQNATNSETQRGQNSCHCVSNMFEITDNGRVFEYDLKYDLKHQTTLQENNDLFDSHIESQFAKVFLTKVSDFKSNKFFSVSMRPSFQLIVQVG